MNKDIVIDGIEYTKKEIADGSVVLIPVKAKTTVEYTFNLTERQINFIYNVLYVVTENAPKWTDWTDGSDCKFSDNATERANELREMFEQWEGDVNIPDVLAGNEDDFLVARWEKE